MTEDRRSPTNGCFVPTKTHVLVTMPTAVLVTFVLGIANFAMHRAVLESGHPLLEQMPGTGSKARRSITFALEFAILLAAMLFAANGWPGFAWAYAGYSALNAASAWFILSGKT